MHTPPLHRDPRPRRRAVAVAVTALAMLALPGAALAATFKLTPHIANHTPIAKRKWPITIDVTSGSKKLSGSVKYEFLFSGAIVKRQKGHSFKNGVYTDQLLFPSTAIGQPLTLRILVTVPKYGTEHIDWKVTTRR
jgi:hypothetical protein